jgi:hypothetical protein
MGVPPNPEEPAMPRDCTRCHRPFTPADLSREETGNLEAGRKEHGLEGVKFVYFRCPACGMNDIFVAILPLETELAEDYEARRGAMEEVVRTMHADGVAAVVVPLQAP